MEKLKNKLNDILYTLELSENLNNEEYFKTVNIIVTYIENNEKARIGKINATYFDYVLALKNNVDIKHIIKDHLEFKEVIEVFNKDYYEFFGKSSRENILAINNFKIDDMFYSEDFILDLIKHIDKVFYSVSGKIVGTIIFKEEPIKYILENLGYITHKSMDSLLYIKNIEKENEFEELNIDEEFIDKLKSNIKIQ